MLHTLSLIQALDIWVELEKALQGESSYGGDTAEIYIYRFLNADAQYDLKRLDADGILGDMARENYDNANTAMHDLFALFAEKRDALIQVEDKELGPWLKKARFTHRVHVKVQATENPSK